MDLKENIFSPLTFQNQYIVWPRINQKRTQKKKAPTKNSLGDWALRKGLTSGLLSLDFFSTVLFLFQATIFGFVPLEFPITERVL